MPGIIHRVLFYSIFQQNPKVDISCRLLQNFANYLPIKLILFNQICMWTNYTCSLIVCLIKFTCCLMLHVNQICMLSTFRIQPSLHVNRI